MDHKDYRLACVMFTDIVGFSRMMETNEAGTLILLEYHNNLIEGRTKEHRGTVIKTIGDAYLVDFTSAVNAVKCAISIQHDLRDYNKEHPETPLVLRIGVHLGDIYFYENDALGEGINIASRLQGTCNPGRICISQDVHNLVANKISEPKIVELGDVKLKNISREIRVWEIQTEGSGKPNPTSSNEKKRSSTAKQNGDSPSNSSSYEDILDSSGAVDVQKLKTRIIGEIKRVGKRLSADQVRSWFGKKPPQGLDEAVDALAERGFISGSTNQSAQKPRAKDSSGSYFKTIGGSDSDWGLSEFKQATREIGREIRDAFKNSSWFGGAPDPNLPVVLPTSRGTGENERDDKRHERQWDKVLKAPNIQADSDAEVVELYRKQTDRSAKKMLGIFRQHLLSYGFVNGLLFLIWFLTSGIGSLPWFLFPLGGWGIGIASHYALVRRRKLEGNDLQALPLQNRKQLRLLRKLHKLRESRSSSVIATIATAAALGIFNIILPGFPWALIAGGAMAFGMFSSFPSFKNKEQLLLEDLGAEGVPTALLASAKHNKAIAGHLAQNAATKGPLHAEALRLQAVILEQLAGFGETKPLGEDFPPLLEDYATQIGDLETRIREITAIVAEFPRHTLKQDIENLTKQLDATTNTVLKKEYKKSIAQVEKQLAAYEDLGGQQKLIELRLTNAMNALRQIQIELVRMRSFGKDAASDAASKDLSDKLDLLSNYAADMRSGYRALDSSEFAELEKYRDTPE